MTTEDTRTYDVIVIGAGPVGENVADRTAAAGLSTVIVESELIGGECSYWACEPSKALLRPALLRADASRVPGLSPAAAGPPDTAAVLAHRDYMAAHWNDDGQAEWLKTAGIDLLRGHGRLDGPRRITVRTPDGATVHLRARHAVAVCTGSRAALPDLPGLDTLRPWTSREATSAPHPPGRLVIVGAGVVATEMATAWQALKSSSPTPRSPPSASPPPKPSAPAAASTSSTTTSATSQAPSSTALTTAAERASSSTPIATPSSAPPSPDQASPNFSIPPPWPSPARLPSSASGMPSPPFPPSAKCGFDCSKRTAINRAPDPGS